MVTASAPCAEAAPASAPPLTMRLAPAGAGRAAAGAWARARVPGAAAPAGWAAPASAARQRIPVVRTPVTRRPMSPVMAMAFPDAGGARSDPACLHLLLFDRSVMVSGGLAEVQTPAVAGR